MLKVSIFKNIEEYQNSKEYKYFEIYDDKENKYVKYNGPSITAHIYIQNESKEIIKMNKSGKRWESNTHTHTHTI